MTSRFDVVFQISFGKQEKMSARISNIVEYIIIPTYDYHQCDRKEYY